MEKIKHRILKKNPAYESVPGGTRTPDLLVRSQSLYPAELQAHLVNMYYYITNQMICQVFFQNFLKNFS